MSAGEPDNLSFADVALILRVSEGRANLTGTRPQPGHGYGRHVAITNAGLNARMANSRADIPLFTAFVTTADQIEAACETLNSAEGKWARRQFFDSDAGRHFPQGSHSGMRAKIFHSGTPRRVRYAGPGGIGVFSNYIMILNRDDTCPLRLHVLTFYATIPLEFPKYLAVVTGANGKPYAEGP